MRPGLSRCQRPSAAPSAATCVLARKRPQACTAHTVIEHRPRCRDCEPQNRTGAHLHILFVFVERCLQALVQSYAIHDRCLFRVDGRMLLGAHCLQQVFKFANFALLRLHRTTQQILCKHKSAVCSHALKCQRRPLPHLCLLPHQSTGEHRIAKICGCNGAQQRAPSLPKRWILCRGAQRFHHEAVHLRARHRVSAFRRAPSHFYTTPAPCSPPLCRLRPALICVTILHLSVSGIPPHASAKLRQVSRQPVSPRH